MARRIPAARSGRRRSWSSGGDWGEVGEQGCVKSYEKTPHPDPLLESQEKRRVRSLRPKAPEFPVGPEFPGFRAETLDRPESPVLNTGVSGPKSSKTADLNG